MKEVKMEFDFNEFNRLFATNKEKAFEYRDSFFGKELKNSQVAELTKDEIKAVLKSAGIKHSNNSKIQTLLKIALDNNLI